MTSVLTKLHNGKKHLQKLCLEMLRCTGVISESDKCQIPVDSLFIKGKKKQFIFPTSEITDTLSSKCYNILQDSANI